MYGRLGNQLWQIASTVGMASHDGANVAFPSWRYASFFNVPKEKFGHVPMDGDHDPGLVHLQELRHFFGSEGLVRDWFSASVTTHSHMVDKYAWFFEIDVPVCAVHVRRGDAIGKEQWHPVQPIEYYQHAIEIVKEWEPGIVFIVFSDGIDWCKQNFPADFIFVSPEHVAIADVVDHEELLLMRLCSEHIIANSSFSWWGSWLSGNPRVVYPEDWYGVAYPALRCSFKSDFISSSWVGL